MAWTTPLRVLLAVVLAAPAALFAEEGADDRAPVAQTDDAARGEPADEEEDQGSILLRLDSELEAVRIEADRQRKKAEEAAERYRDFAAELKAMRGRNGLNGDWDARSGFEAQLMAAAAAGRIGRSGLFGRDTLVFEITGDDPENAGERGASLLPGMYRYRPSAHGARLERINPKAGADAFFDVLAQAEHGAPPYDAYDSLYTLKYEPASNPFGLPFSGGAFSFATERGAERFREMYARKPAQEGAVAGKPAAGHVLIGGNDYHWTTEYGGLSICSGDNCLLPGSPEHDRVKARLVAQGLWSEPAGDGPVGERANRDQLPLAMADAAAIRDVPGPDADPRPRGLLGDLFNFELPTAKWGGIVPSGDGDETAAQETAGAVVERPAPKPEWTTLSRRHLKDGRFTTTEFRVSDAGVQRQVGGEWVDEPQAYYLDPVTGELSRDGKIIGTMGVSTSDERNRPGDALLVGDASLRTRDGRVWTYMPSSMDFSGPGAQRGVDYVIVNGRDPQLPPLDFSRLSTKRVLIDNPGGGLRSVRMRAFTPTRAEGGAPPTIERGADGSIAGYTRDGRHWLSPDGRTRVDAETGEVLRYVHRMSNYYTLAGGRKNMSGTAAWVEDPYTRVVAAGETPPAPQNYDDVAMPLVFEQREEEVQPTLIARGPTGGEGGLRDAVAADVDDTAAADVEEEIPERRETQVEPATPAWPPADRERLAAGGWLDGVQLKNEAGEKIGWLFDGAQGRRYMYLENGGRVYTADGATLLGPYDDFNWQSRQVQTVLGGGTRRATLIPRQNGRGYIDADSGRAYEGFSQLVGGRVTTGIRPQGSRERYPGGPMPQDRRGPIHASADGFWEMARAHSGRMIVKVSPDPGAWFYCPQCTKMEPAMNAYADEMRSSNVAVVSLSVSQAQAQGLGTGGFPRILVVENGRIVATHNGAKPLSSLRGYGGAYNARR